MIPDDISDMMSSLFPVSWDALTKPPGDTNE
jgi:hypothetical protein